MKPNPTSLTLARLSSLSADNQSIALAQCSPRVRAAKVNQAREAFLKNGAVTENLSSLELIELVEALNFTVESNKDFGYIFKNLKLDNIPAGIAGLNTISKKLENAILNVRQTKKHFTLIARAECEERGTTLSDASHFDLLTAPDDAALYFYNENHNEYHSIKKMKPILTALHMVNKYIENVNTKIAERKAAKEAKAAKDAKATKIEATLETA
jgi:hypothetical protein